MKKTFDLNVPNKKRERQVESIKHEVRKYIKREKNKILPDDYDYWKFVCKFALENEEVQNIEFTEIITCIDKAYESQKDTFYLEILKEPAKREKKEDL